MFKPTKAVRYTALGLGAGTALHFGVAAGADLYDDLRGPPRTAFNNLSVLSLSSGSSSATIVLGSSVGEPFVTNPRLGGSDYCAAPLLSREQLLRVAEVLAGLPRPPNTGFVCCSIAIHPWPLLRRPFSQ